MTCKLGNLEVVVTSVYLPSKSKAKDKDLVAFFSINIIEPLTGIILMSCNKFSLRGKPGKWRIFSRFETVYDPYAPEEIPDDQAFKTLFLVSFFPKNSNKGKDIDELRNSFVNSLGDAVIKKLQYHRQRAREISIARNNSNGNNKYINQNKKSICQNT